MFNTKLLPSTTAPMNSLRNILIILVCASLTGCAGRDDQDTGNRRSRGLTIWQLGLVNVSGSPVLTAPEPRDTSRLVIDQRLRFDNQLTK
jgi:type IV pilus biogenesis protein CpaD/CtpE